jgi:hypothetical protein
MVRNRSYSIIFVLLWTIGFIITCHRYYIVDLDIFDDQHMFHAPITGLYQFLTSPFETIQHQYPIQPYITDIVCSGCRHSIADPNNPDSERCGYYIEEQRRLDKTNSTMRQIIENVVQQYPLGCTLCRQPNNILSNKNELPCSINQYRYWRYDSVITSTKLVSYTKDTWFPSSKPLQNHFTIPTPPTTTIRTNDKFNTLLLQYYYSTNIPIQSTLYDYFMEYNPSILILPEYQYTLLQLNRQNNNNSYYIISFRISNQNYCFHPMDRKYMIQQKLQQQQGESKPLNNNQDYLGIIIVDALSFHILYDTIVNVQRVGFTSSAQDFRLFVLKNQIYLSSYDTITPIWLTIGRGSSSSTISSSTNIPPNNDAILVPTVFNNNNSDNNHSSSLLVWIRKSLSCVQCHRKRGLCGKNFNYFIDSTKTNNDTTTSSLVEIWPTGPHTVYNIDLNQPCQRQMEPTLSYISSTPEAHPSFPTMEEVDFPLLGRMESIFTRGRGSACCIPIQHNDTNRTLLVGIQHSKTPSQRNKRLPPNLTSNHYMSSLYAFESVPPYNIVAQSGYFCLGFPTEEYDQMQNTTTLHRITSWRKLVLGRHTYNCPRIHFVSGMTIKANDPNTVILAYGINDCISRFIEIRLSDIYHLLFIGPLTYA